MTQGSTVLVVSPYPRETLLALHRNFRIDLRETKILYSKTGLPCFRLDLKFERKRCSRVHPETLVDAVSVPWCDMTVQYTHSVSDFAFGCFARLLFRWVWATIRVFCWAYQGKWSRGRERVRNFIGKFTIASILVISLWILAYNTTIKHTMFSHIIYYFTRNSPRFFHF